MINYYTGVLRCGDHLMQVLKFELHQDFLLRKPTAKSNQTEKKFCDQQIVENSVNQPQPGNLKR
jgi:hypothetical protein